mmetsp:Transcript_66290/g.215709  ORF Transcript_66290/g.215709 Transcript_66290/m.215709 type:complete len:203 (-) Transcript_66290:991-1599(-)
MRPLKQTDAQPILQCHFVVVDRHDARRNAQMLAEEHSLSTTSVRMRRSQSLQQAKYQQHCSAVCSGRCILALYTETKLRIKCDAGNGVMASGDACSCEGSALYKCLVARALKIVEHREPSWSAQKCPHGGPTSGTSPRGSRRSPRPCRTSLRGHPARQRLLLSAGRSCTKSMSHARSHLGPGRSACSTPAWPLPGGRPCAST